MLSAQKCDLQWTEESKVTSTGAAAAVAIFLSLDKAMFDLSNIASWVPGGYKGRAAMELAIYMGYVENPGKMRAYYNENQSEIEGWAKHVDMEAIVENLR